MRLQHSTISPDHFLHNSAPKADLRRAAKSCASPPAQASPKKPERGSAIKLTTANHGYQQLEKSMYHDDQPISHLDRHVEHHFCYASSDFSVTSVNLLRIAQLHLPKKPHEKPPFCHTFSGAPRIFPGRCEAECGADFYG
jgi:hypothetical protein